MVLMGSPEPFVEYDPSPIRRQRIDVITRPAAPSDVGSCATLAVRRDGGDPEQWRSRFANCLDADGCALFVAAVDGEVVAYGRLERLEPAPVRGSAGAPAGWYLAGIVVDPRWRRRGIAAALTKARLDWAWQHTDEVWYFANARNRATLDLHEGFGFVEVTRDFAIPGVTFDNGQGSGILFRCRRPQGR
jgi:ribosomal protein S18 acetylase RimI-like enzyme